MEKLAQHVMVVEGELSSPVATAQLVHFDFPVPVDSVMDEKPAYRMDLCLTPRPGNARACFPEHWQACRYERIGRLFMVPPGEPLKTISDGCCRQSSIVCEFHPEPLSDWLGEDLQYSERGLQASLDIGERNLISLLQRLAREAREPGFGSEILVELITAQVAIELSRYLAESGGPADNRGGLATWRLRAIDERLREVRAPPTLAELAGLCGLSVRQLTRGFRASRGQSIGEHVAATRLEHAKQLLLQDTSVKSVALTLGFASSSSFSHAFRQATGETPTRFRQQQRRIH